MSGDVPPPDQPPARGPQILALGPALLLTGRVIPSFAQYAFSGEDSLLVTVTGVQGGTWTLQGRFLDAVSSKILPIVVSGSVVAGATTQTLVPVTTGYILNIGISYHTSATTFFPGAYCQLALCRGLQLQSQTPLGLILQGYAYRLANLGFPGSAFFAPNEVPGWLNGVTGTQPAHGTDIVQYVPAEAEWEFQFIRFSLTTDATPGNRFVILRTMSPYSDAWTDAITTFQQPPSTTVWYQYWHGATQMSAAIGADITVPLPFQLPLEAGAAIYTQTDNLVAGDQYSAPQFLVRERVYLR